MNSIFEWQELYRTSERSERVRYSSCHENIKFTSFSQRVIFFLLYKRADDVVFRVFSKISDHFPKISEDFSKLLRKRDERFRTFSEHFRRFSEDHRRLLKTTEEDPKCFDHSPTNFSALEVTKEKCYQIWYIHMWGYHIFTFNNYSPQARWIFSNYWMRLSRIWRILQVEESVILRDLQNSSYPTKAEFNNCFIIHSKSFLHLICKLYSRPFLWHNLVPRFSRSMVQ